MGIKPGDYDCYVTVIEGPYAGTTAYYDDDDTGETGQECAALSIGAFLNNECILVPHGQLRKATAAEIKAAEATNGPLWEGQTALGSQKKPIKLTPEEFEAARQAMNEVFGALTPK